MPGIRGKRLGCGHLGALFALRECHQCEGAEELQSLPWRPLALRGPGREFAGGHASASDRCVITPPTVIECADDQEAVVGKRTQLSNRMAIEPSEGARFIARFPSVG
jgi:hypothetical protein